MTLLNTKDSYGAVSRFNHWLGAALIITLLAVGLYFHDMPRGDEKLFWLRLHMSIGALSVLFLFFRVAWSALPPSPAPVPQPALLQWVTRAIHIVLLAALVVLMTTGPLLPWSGGRDLAVFNWFSLPSPLPKMEDLHEVLENVHAVASRVVLFSLILHVVGAVKHLVWDRDGSWRRMVGLRVSANGHSL
ncbi:MAG: cytochrome b/b6 domain-containing protein [Gammaproteobacteria bacterium]